MLGPTFIGSIAVSKIHPLSLKLDECIDYNIAENIHFFEYLNLSLRLIHPDGFPDRIFGESVIDDNDILSRDDMLEIR